MRDAFLHFEWDFLSKWAGGLIRDFRLHGMRSDLIMIGFENQGDLPLDS